ncbi:MAG: hypothetical protein KYX63_05430 [Alteromonas macleodii]|nr:hypothetical protein [Alteromonas macleodii]
MRSKKKTNKIKTKQSSKAKNILRSAISKRKKIKRIFEKLSLTELRHSTKDVFEDKELGDWVKLYRKKNDIRIYNYGIPDVSLPQSIYWSLGVIKNNINKIEIFSKKEKELNDLVLLQKWDQALKILDEVDELCGISTWSNSIRASIIAEKEDYSSLNELYKSLTSDLYEYNVYEVICRQAIFKTYHDETVIESRDRLNRQLRNTFGDDLYYFLKYKILTFNPVEKYDFEHIFNFELNSTLIDLYLCVSDFTIYSEINLLHSELKKEIINSLSKPLRESIFSKISESYSVPSYDWTISESDAELLENYTTGNYSGALENVLMRQEGLSFNAVKICAKSMCRLENISIEENYLNSFLKNFRNYFSKSDLFTRSQNELYRQATNFKQLNFFKKLNLFLIQEDNREQIKDKKKTKEVMFLISDINSPFRSEYLLPEIKDKYFKDTFNAKYKSTTALFNLYKNKIPLESQELANVNEDRKMSYYAKSLANQGENEKVIEILSSLQNTTDTLIKLEASNLLILTFINNENEAQGIQTFNDYVLENRNFIHCLDSSKVAESAEARLRKNPKISEIIALSLYCRFVDDSKYKTLRAAFNNYMRINRLNSPLEILERKDLSISNNEANYFLNYIATPQIMKFFSGFRSPNDIDKCRVNICNYLISIGESKNEKISEVKSITKRLVLREATLQVAQSKVDADLSSLKAGKNESHISLFQNYIKSRKNYRDEFESTFQIYSLLAQLGDKDFAYTFITQEHFNEMCNTFVKLVRTVIEEFSFGEKGLNANVSTRIRHGHLPNTIRRSFLDEKISTSMSKSSKTIRPNDYWIKKLAREENKESILKAFSSFTQKLEKIIHKVNEEILQVNTLEANLTGLSKSTKALFRYSPTNEEIITLQSKIDETCSYGEFITIIEGWLWELTENNLQKIRQYITENISPDITNELREKLANENISIDAMYEFNNALNRANRGLVQNVKTVESWFKRNGVIASKPFDLDIAAQIASKALLLDVDLDNKKNTVLKGFTLSSFVDIFYILYENSISKSGLEKTNLEISHSANLDNNVLTIIYENSCLPYESAEIENHKIREFKDSYGNEEIMMQRIHSEGGTGFAKIWKILQKDLSCFHTMNFGFTERNSFEVVLNIKNNGLINYENTTD